MVPRIALLALLFAALPLGWAEDRREREYMVPALKPHHADKPRITGWARQRAEERLDRGLVAVPAGEGRMYLSWRFLKRDAPGTGFHVYRTADGQPPLRLNRQRLTVTTDFVDEQPLKGRRVTYSVRAVLGDHEEAASPPAEVAAECAASATVAAVPVRRIEFPGRYVPQRMAVADLDGDGAYDFVIKQPQQGIDPAGKPDTSGLTYKLEAYRSDGTFLWRHDLGPGIEPGIWYSPFVVYDFDGDGRADVAVKTGPRDARQADGRVRQGPEWVSILDGLTGEEITRADWPPRDPRLGDYNRINRNQIGVAYLDGKTPCLLVARGTYKRMVLDAYQYHHRQLQRLWHWEGDDEKPIIRSQGAHNLIAADVDEDGRDEVVLGSVVVDDNGTALWSTGFGHPDKVIVSDIDPSRPGLEIFYAIEPDHDDGNGVCLVEAKTGRTIWNIGQPTRHVGDGMAADIDPVHPGLECFAAEDSKGGSSDRYLFSAAGQRLGRRADVPGCRNWVFWDGDLLRETFGTGRGPLSVVKYQGPTLTTGIEGRFLFAADILGDWREEIITVLPGEMLIYTTTRPAKDRRAGLMQDPLYRSAVTQRSQGYEQSPLTGYYLGEGARIKGDE